MVCECCQKESPIVWGAKWINKFDQELFHLCKNCLKLKFCFTTKYPSLVYARRDLNNKETAMKASEIIAELSRLQGEFGDLDVKINYSLSDTDQTVCDVYEDWLDENAYDPVPPDFLVIS